MTTMVRIRFPDRETERKGIGFLAGRFSFRSHASGEMLVPAPALAALAVEGIRFTVEGWASYEQSIPAVRTPPAAVVQ
jgi:hypothetical protein